MTLPHPAGIFTVKQLTETTREQLPAAGQPVTVHRMDLAKAPASPVTDSYGLAVILPPGPCPVRVVRTRHSVSDRSPESDKGIRGYFLKNEEKSMARRRCLARHYYSTGSGQRT